MKRAANDVLQFLVGLAIVVAAAVLVLYIGAAVVHLLLDVVVAGWESVS